MSCRTCTGQIFKEKLGRCKSCMMINFVLLLGSALGWFICYQSGPTQVASIALLFTLIASAVLMLSHLIAYLYYHFKK